jgi:hypothetical protein
MPEIFNSSKRHSSVSAKDAAALENAATAGDSLPEPNPIVEETQAPTHAHKSATQRKHEAVARLMEDMKMTSNPLSAFSPRPNNMCLDIQLKDEEVLLLMRQHPITQLKWIVIAVVLIFLPLWFSYIPFLNFLPMRFQTVALIGWYLLVLGFSLEAFLGWFYNIYIVTNERVIDIDFNSLLFKNISTAQLEKIEDVSVTNKGYLGSIFDFGTVVTQTAGATDVFEFADTPHPNRVSAFINELLRQEEIQ